MWPENEPEEAINDQIRPQEAQGAGGWDDYGSSSPEIVTPAVTTASRHSIFSRLKEKQQAIKSANELRRKKRRSHHPKTVIGVALGRDALRLVKIVVGDGAYKLVEYRTEPLFPDMEPGNEDYAAYIKKVLDGFCDEQKHVLLYVALQSVDVIVRNLRVPEVPDKKMTHAVFWSFKKDVDIDDEDFIFDYELTSQDEEDEGAAVKQIPVMAYATERAPVMVLKDMFDAIGYPVQGFTFPFFAARNLFVSGWIPSQGKPVAFFYIDNDSSRITVYNGSAMPFSRGIKFGVESFVAAIKERSAEKMSDNDARRILFSMGFDNPPVRPGEPGYGMEVDEIMEMVDSTLQRMIRQVERTLHYCSETLQLGAIDEIYVSGELCSCEMLIFSLREQVKAELFLINPFEYTGNIIGMEPPISISERALYAAAIGVALWTDDHTPNLLYTCREKESAKRTNWLNRIVFAVFLLITISLGILFFFQMQNNRRIEAEKGALLRQTKAMGAVLDEDMVHTEAMKVMKKNSELHKYVRRYYGIAILGELTKLTPESVRLTRFDLKMLPEAKEDGTKKVRNTVRIEGVIHGEYSALTSLLAAYIASLEKSDMFINVVSTDEVIDTGMEDGPQLRFALLANLEALSSLPEIKK